MTNEQIKQCLRVQLLHRPKKPNPNARVMHTANMFNRPTFNQWVQYIRKAVSNA